LKVEINLKIILLGILFFVLEQLDMYLIFLIFIVFHEIAHMLVGIICGLKPKNFCLNPLGVSVEFYMYGTRERKKKIATYLAGPLLNLIMALIFSVISIDENLKMKIVYTNLVLALFNLIPILPLDGGKILKEILIKKVGNKNSGIFMNQLSQVILVVITLLYSIFILQMKNFAIFLVIMYLWYLKYIEDKKLKTMIKAYEVIEKN